MLTVTWDHGIVKEPDAVDWSLRLKHAPRAFQQDQRQDDINHTEMLRISALEQPAHEDPRGCRDSPDRRDDHLK